MTASGYRVIASHVVSDVFDDGEAAVIDLRTGVYFSLNPTGALLWPLILDGATLDSLVELATSATTGGSDVSSWVERFVAALVAEGLVEEVTDARPDGSATVATEPIPFTPPELERFDDLTELLLLDPIHDVSDQGWPHRPPD